MIGSIIWGLGWASLVLRICHGWFSVRARAVIFVLVVVLALLPFPWGLNCWLLAITGEFSITTGLLAMLATVHRMRGKTVLTVSEWRAAGVLLAVLARRYSPMRLGATYLDPYALGYGDYRLSTALLLVGLFAWVCRAYVSCFILIIAQGAYWFGVLGSDNLWDYLIDPYLCFLVLGWTVRDIYRRSCIPIQVFATVACCVASVSVRPYQCRIRCHTSRDR